MATKAKEFRYAIDHGERFRTEDGTPLDADIAWTPEHLLLAALVRCSVKSLDYHARRAGNRVESSNGSAHALFTRRDVGSVDSESTPSTVRKGERAHCSSDRCSSRKPCTPPLLGRQSHPHVLEAH